MSSRLEQIVSAIKIGNNFDLRDALRGAHPDDEAELVSVFERYTECRIAEHGSIEFEEYRRAIPWIFESPVLLRSAFESVLFAAISNGQNPIAVGRAIARGHPLAASTAESILARFVDADGFVLPTPEIRPLPCAFGPKDLDGSLRYTLTARIRRGRGYALYAATDSMADEKGISPDVIVWIGLAKATGDGYTELALRDLPLGVLAKRWFLNIREQGVAVSGENFVAYERSPESSALADYLQSADPSVRRRIIEVRDIAHAVEHLHSVGFVHGDVSPRNIFVDASGQCVLAVYPGCVADAQDDAEAHQGGSGGLISFVSPEQYAGSEPTPASDVYELGALLLYAVAGVYANGSESEAAHNYLISDIGAQVGPLPGCPGEILSLALRCLDRTPDARPISATVFRELLDRWLNDEPIDRTAALGTRARLFVRRHRGLLASAVLLFAGLVAAGVWFAQARTNSSVEQVRSAYAVSMAESEESRRLLAAELTAAQAQVHELDAEVLRAAEESERQLDEEREKVMQARKILARVRQGVMLNEANKPEILLFITSAWQSMDIHDPSFKGLLDADAAADAKERADELWRSGSSRIESALWQLIAADKLLTSHESELAEKYLLRAEKLFGDLEPGDDMLLQRLRAEIAEADASQASGPDTVEPDPSDDP